MTTKITADNIEQSTLDILGGSGPAIANVKITSNTYTILDDTAVSTDGGYIIVNGSNFDPNVNILLDGTAATSVTRVSSTQLQAEIPALSAGSKVLYVINTDTGSTTILLNGVTYSGTPTWVTASSLEDQTANSSISIQLSATSDSNVTYQLQSGSSLPSGLTLAANGLLSGTVTVANDTLYNFTIEATDAENQESPRSFSVTIVVPDEYFRYTTLLLNGDGTSGANNNVFIDSSDNNLPISRVADAGQGSFSPFSTPDGRWSVYFDGNGDQLYIASGSALTLGTDDFTIEFWYCPQDLSAQYRILADYRPGTSQGLYPTILTNYAVVGFYFNTAMQITGTTTLQVGTWYHIAVARSGSSTKLFVNGVQDGSTLTDTNNYIGATFYISGNGFGAGFSALGHISNVRIVKGTAVYTTTFTPPTAPLTAITNTQLLACQSKNFLDNSSVGHTFTKNGDSKVSSFSPFAPNSLYSPTTAGGSVILDGTGDYLEVPIDNTAPLDFDTNDWTIEFWYYRSSTAARTENLFQFSTGPCMLWFGDVIYYQRSAGSSVIWAGLPATLPAGARGGWYHYAMVRDGGRVTMYVDGKYITGITNETANFSDVGSLRIGMGNYGVAQGHISNFRIINGTALYTYSGTPSNGTQVFSPPTQLLTNVANTKLLCNFTNGGIIDRTNKNNIQTMSDAEINTTTKKYGTGSMSFDGVGDYLDIYSPSREMFVFGTGDFTVEFFFYLNGSGKLQAIYDPRVGGADSSAVGMIWIKTTNVLYYYATGADRITGTTTLSTGVWYHAAVCRVSGTTTLYLNGSSEGSFADSLDYNFAVTSFRIGQRYTGTAYNFDGYIDDLRVTKGIARYTANFTPPASAHKLR